MQEAVEIRRAGWPSLPRKATVREEARFFLLFVFSRFSFWKKRPRDRFSTRERIARGILTGCGATRIIEVIKGGGFLFNDFVIARSIPDARFRLRSLRVTI